MNPWYIPLGDIAYWVFRPFVYFYDWIWGSDLKDCEACHERRVKWNALINLHPAWNWIVKQFKKIF